MRSREVVNPSVKQILNPKGFKQNTKLILHRDGVVFLLSSPFTQDFITYIKPQHILVTVHEILQIIARKLEQGFQVFYQGFL